MMVAGNHDVDGAEIPQDGPVDLIHREIREAATLEQHTVRLAEVLSDAQRGETLHHPNSRIALFATTVAKTALDHAQGVDDGGFHHGKHGTTVAIRAKILFLTFLMLNADVSGIAIPWKLWAGTKQSTRLNVICAIAFLLVLWSARSS